MGRLQEAAKAVCNNAVALLAPLFGGGVVFVSNSSITDIDQAEAAPS